MQKPLDEIKTALFGRFEVRKSVQQKKMFARWACEYARSLDWSAQEECSGGVIATRNLVFGNVSKARTLITAHYDTCARLPFGNPYTPQCWPVIVLTQLCCPLRCILQPAYGWALQRARCLPRFPHGLPS